MNAKARKNVGANQTKTAPVQGGGVGGGSFLNQLETARQSPEKKVEPLVLGGSIFGQLDFSKIAQKAQELKDAEAAKLRQVDFAKEIAGLLVGEILEMEHFFHAGDPDFVAAAKSNATEQMEAYKAIVRYLNIHNSEGSVEKDEDNGLFIGEKKDHCVVPARLASMERLVELASPRMAGNGGELRGLNPSEIAKIARSYGALVSTDEPKGPYLKADEKYLVLGRNGQVSEENQEAFRRITARVLEAGKEHFVQICQERKKHLREQATVSSFDHAMEQGGILLASIPVWDRPIAGKAANFPGGKVLLNFGAEWVTFGGDPDNFASGKDFADYMVNLRKEKSKVSLEDVKRIIGDSSAEKPNRKLEVQDFKLWFLLRRLVVAVEEARYEMDAISRMSKDGDLSQDEFVAGKEGEMVLFIERFSAKSGGKFCPLPPSAIRICRKKVEDKVVLSLIEASPALQPFVEAFVGKDFPEANTKDAGNFGRFLYVWQMKLSKQGENDESEETESEE